MNKSDSSSNLHKPTYTAPKISKLGNLTELTQGQVGSNFDGMSGMGQR